MTILFLDSIATKCQIRHYNKDDNKLRYIMYGQTDKEIYRVDV